MFQKFKNINEKRITERSVFLLIHNKGPISKSDILQELGGSLSNINRFIVELEDAEMIKGSEASGRRPALYSVNSDTAYAIGGYINPDVVGLGICDINGQVIESYEVFFNDLNSPEAVVGFFRDSYRKLKDTHGDKRCLGIGIGETGPMDKLHKIMLAPPYLPEWVNVPMHSMLEAELDSPVILDNFAESALIGELFFGTRNMDSHIGLIWADKGIGASSSNRGVMYLDQHDRTAMLGHQVVNFNGNPCVCGKLGCLETYATINNHLKSMEPFIDNRLDTQIHKESFRQDPWHVSPELELIEQAMQASGDLPQFSYVLREFDQALASAIGNLTRVIRFDELIFCGRLAWKYKERFTNIMDRISDSSDFFAENPSKLTWLDLDAASMIRGGAALVFNQYINFVE